MSSNRQFTNHDLNHDCSIYSLVAEFTSNLLKSISTSLEVIQSQDLVPPIELAPKNEKFELYTPYLYMVVARIVDLDQQQRRFKAYLMTAPSEGVID